MIDAQSLGGKNMSANFLNDVIGHDYQKSELNNVVKWFKNSEYYENLGAHVPHGIIFSGEPGNGKSMIMRSIKNALDLPTFVFENKGGDIVQQLDSLFNNAKKEKKSVVIIDELDLLIDKDTKVVRCLQENLDGVENKTTNTLVITACNDIDEVPLALLRTGRLEKIIEINTPNKQEIKEYLEYCASKLHLNTDFIEDKDVISGFYGKSFSDIKSIMNEVVLRNDGHVIDSDKILDVISLNDDGAIRKKEPVTLKTCIHEAGHAVVASVFTDYFSIGSLKVNGDAGYYISKSNNSNSDHNVVLAKIQIMLAGTIAEKIFAKYSCLGNTSDIVKTYKLAVKLVTNSAFFDPSLTVDDYSDNYSDWKFKRVDLSVKKIIKKCERSAKKILLNNKKIIFILAQKLFEKHFLKSHEVQEILQSAK